MGIVAKRPPDDHDASAGQLGLFATGYSPRPSMGLRLPVARALCKPTSAVAAARRAKDLPELAGSAVATAVLARRAWS
jgi:hypothetical protein